MLIGYGQVNQHDEHPGVEPVDLMVAAARAAADPRVLEAVDSVRVVNLLSWRYRDPGLLLAQRIAARRRRHPLHRRRRQCPAVAGQSGVPGHPGRPRRCRADRGRRDVAHPNAGAGRRRQARLDEPGRVRPDRRGRRRGCADGRARGAPDQARPARLRVSDVRAGAADRGRGVTGRPPPPHRRTVVAVQRGGRDEPACLEPGAVVAPSRSGNPARQPDDQLAVPEADELEQHGRSGRGAGAHVGREGDVSSDPFGPLGFPVCGHRCARHLRDQRARGVPRLAGDQDRGETGAGVGRVPRRRRRA